MRTSKKALAASFVMTFAAGCDSKESAPPAAPTVDVGPGTAPATASASATAPATATAPGTATASVTATATATATPPATAAGTGAAASASVAQKLPPAPTTGHVMRQSDGTCMWFADVQCPKGPNGRIMPCNPPRPHEVECPPDAGKSP